MARALRFGIRSPVSLEHDQAYIVRGADVRPRPGYRSEVRVPEVHKGAIRESTTDGIVVVPPLGLPTVFPYRLYRGPGETLRADERLCAQRVGGIVAEHQRRGGHQRRGQDRVVGLALVSSVQ